MLQRTAFVLSGVIGLLLPVDTFRSAALVWLGTLAHLWPFGPLKVLSLLTGLQVSLCPACCVAGSPASEPAGHPALLALRGAGTQPSPWTLLHTLPGAEASQTLWLVELCGPRSPW